MCINHSSFIGYNCLTAIVNHILKPIKERKKPRPKKFDFFPHFDIASKPELELKLKLKPKPKPN